MCENFYYLLDKYYIYDKSTNSQSTFFVNKTVSKMFYFEFFPANSPYSIHPNANLACHHPT